MSEQTEVCRDCGETLSLRYLRYHEDIQCRACFEMLAEPGDFWHDLPPVLPAIRMRPGPPPATPDKATHYLVQWHDGEYGLVYYTGMCWALRSLTSRSVDDAIAHARLPVSKPRKLSAHECAEADLPFGSTEEDFHRETE